MKRITILIISIFLVCVVGSLLPSVRAAGGRVLVDVFECLGAGSFAGTLTLPSTAAQGNALVASTNQATARLENQRFTYAPYADRSTDPNAARYRTQLVTVVTPEISAHSISPAPTSGTVAVSSNICTITGFPDQFTVGQYIAVEPALGGIDSNGFTDNTWLNGVSSGANAWTVAVSSGVATVDTIAAHGLSTGDIVSFCGTWDNTWLNSGSPMWYTVTSTPDTHTFLVDFNTEPLLYYGGASGRYIPADQVATAETPGNQYLNRIYKILTTTVDGTITFAVTHVDQIATAETSGGVLPLCIALTFPGRFQPLDITLMKSDYDPSNTKTVSTLPYIVIGIRNSNTKQGGPNTIEFTTPPDGDVTWVAPTSQISNGIYNSQGWETVPGWTRSAMAGAPADAIFILPYGGNTDPSIKYRLHFTGYVQQEQP